MDYTELYFAAVNTQVSTGYSDSEVFCCTVKVLTWPVLAFS